MSKFKIGDKVRCNSRFYIGVKEGEIVTVSEYIENGCFYINESVGEYAEEDFTLVILKQNSDTTKCYECGNLNVSEYQVMIYDDAMNLKFVKCCSMRCANISKGINSRYLKDMYEKIDRQCIQRLK